MQQAFIFKTRAGYRVNLAVMTRIDQMAWHFGDYYFPELVDTVKYILKNIFVCIIKELFGDLEESK
jgi:hypothetical protein